MTRGMAWKNLLLLTSCKARPRTGLDGSVIRLPSRPSIQRTGFARTTGFARPTGGQSPSFGRAMPVLRTGFASPLDGLFQSSGRASPVFRTGKARPSPNSNVHGKFNFIQCIICAYFLHSVQVVYVL